MKGYSASEVAVMLGLSAAQIRSYAKVGFLEPERGPRGQLRFTFHDLVLLRTAKALTDARIPARKIRVSLARLREQLPSGRPLSAVRISAEGDRVVVRDGDSVWTPESGQVLFDFAVSDLATQVAPLARRAAESARRTSDLSADDWYDLGFELEISEPEEGRDAYRRAIELDPFHVDAHVNLGRLLHESGELRAAEAHYRVAVQVEPDHAIAWFNLGVVLEDLKRDEDAIDAYEAALAIDDTLADGHYNVAGLYERLGRKAGAVRHLKRYKALVEA